MPRHRSHPGRRPGLRRAPAAATAVVLAALAAGCMRPLAVQDEYFAPMGGAVARASMETRHALSHHRALQAAQRACPATAAPALPLEPGHPAAGPDRGWSAARDALGEVCATTVARTAPVSAHGAASNAHRRWVEDEVRELPAPSETASSVGGS